VKYSKRVARKAAKVAAYSKTDSDRARVAAFANQLNIKMMSWRFVGNIPLGEMTGFSLDTHAERLTNSAEGQLLAATFLRRLRSRLGNTDRVKDHFTEAELALLYQDPMCASLEE